MLLTTGFGATYKWIRKWYRDSTKFWHLDKFLRYCAPPTDNSLFQAFDRLFMHWNSSFDLLYSALVKSVLTSKSWGGPHNSNCCLSLLLFYFLFVLLRYQLKGFGSKSKHKASRSASFIQSLQKHEYESDGRIHNETEDGKSNSSAGKSDGETPRRSWASRLVVQ